MRAISICDPAHPSIQEDYDIQHPIRATAIGSEMSAESSRESEWEAVQSAALEAYDGARTNDACHLWRHAYEIAAGMQQNDPRRAASASNAGLALLIDGKIREAKSTLDEAIGLWTRSATWVDAMEISHNARSTLFHFRLEQRHGDTYTAIRRGWNQKLLIASAALTTFNQALVCFRLDDYARADDLLRQSIEMRLRACGSHDAHLTTMTAAYAARPNAPSLLNHSVANSSTHRSPAQQSQGTIHVRGTRHTSNLSDQRRLDSAVDLTVPARERDVTVVFRKALQSLKHNYASSSPPNEQNM